MLSDLRRHFRFLLSFALGLLVGLIAFHAPLLDRLLIFSVTFSLTYLIATGVLIHRMDADIMRGRASRTDEGMKLIVPLALASVAISLYAILLTIRDPHSGLALRPALALASVPLTWAMFHTVMAFHYARLWYARDAHGREARCLGFPDANAAEGKVAKPYDPGIWDFLYYSFTLGVAVQTADVVTYGAHARRITLFHSTFAFFYNTVLLALAVNAGMALA